MGVRRALRLLAFSAIVTAAVTALMVPTRRLPPKAAAINTAITFLYILPISGLSWAALSGLNRGADRKSFLGGWPMLAAALALAAIAGTAIAAVLMHEVFHVGPTLGAVFRSRLAIAMPVTLIAGILTTLIQRSRQKLKQTERTLQEQRLDNERAERAAAEARLASLASRVRPHFLFNTLNVIAALIREDPEGAEQTVERLGRLLRASLDQGDTIPLANELDLARAYLEVQHTRMGDRLRFRITSDAGLDVVVLPFSIQTLVENAVKHVGEARAEGVLLHVRARRSHEHIEITVTDNGPGFDAGAVPPGRGLDTLRARLRAAFAGQAHLEFERTANGMTARLTLPSGDDALR